MWTQVDMQNKHASCKQGSVEKHLWLNFSNKCQLFNVNYSSHLVVKACHKGTVYPQRTLNRYHYDIHSDLYDNCTSRHHRQYNVTIFAVVMSFRGRYPKRAHERKDGLWLISFAQPCSVVGRVLERQLDKRKTGDWKAVCLRKRQ